MQKNTFGQIIVWNRKYIISYISRYITEYVILLYCMEILRLWILNFPLQINHVMIRLQLRNRIYNKLCATISSVQFSSVTQLCPTLRPRELQHARPPCPSPSPGVHANSHPSSQWCHPAISSSVIPFSSCPQPLPGYEYSKLLSFKFKII